jgi:CHAT domain-containing protein/Tfp pilus assembly protein PilF
LGLTSLLALLTLARPSAAASGVVVVVVLPGYEAARADLRPGDVLLEWEQGRDHGTFVSTFDVERVEIEQGPRGPVTVRGVRDGRPLEATLTWDEWSLSTRPQFSEDELAIVVPMVQLAQAAREPERDAAALRAIRDGARALPAGDSRSWMLSQIARAQARLGALDDIRDTLDEARRGAREAGHTFVEAALWGIEMDLWSATGRPQEARAAAREAVAVHRRAGLGLAGANRLLALVGLIQQGTVVATDISNGAASTYVEYERTAPTSDDATADDRREASKAAHEAVAVVERLAPASASLAQALVNLGAFLPTTEEQVACFRRALAIRDQGPEGLAVVGVMNQICRRQFFDHPQQCLDYSRRSAALEEKFEPDTLDHADALAGLAAAYLYLGDLDPAEAVERRALEIRERRVPDSIHVADSLDRLGSIALVRGDYAQAEAHYRRAVDIDQRKAPGTVMLAKKLQSLGQLLRTLYEPAEAEVHLRRALEIFEKNGVPPLIAGCLAILAGAAEDQGDTARAEAHYRRALDTLRAVGPEAPIVAMVQQNLGVLLSQHDRLDEAETLYADALARVERAGDRGRGVAELKSARGSLRLRRGDLPGAESDLKAALQYFERAAPGSGDLAEVCQNLSVVVHRRGRNDESLALLQRATREYDAQSRRMVRAPEAQAALRATHAVAYLDLEDALVERGRGEEALQVSERARAWTLLTQMSERAVGPGPQVPAALEAERHAADADYDRRLLEVASAEGVKARAQAERNLETARRDRDDVRSRIRAAAPRAAAFHDPVPLDLAGIRRVLEPGTLLLSYRLGDESSRVYAVGPGPDDFAVVAIEGGAAAIGEEVKAFRERIESRRTAVLQAALFRQAQDLSRRLLAPVAARIDRAERLLVVPDGALNRLPFAALADPAAGAEPRYLVEAKPLHVVSSATLYAALTRARDARAGAPVIAGVGDPVYSGPPGAMPPALTRSVRRGLRLSPLPWARKELEALRELSPRGTTLWMGVEATEARAKSLGDGPKIIHFACHGFVDERFPLESGLALSVPASPAAGEDNGLLQAWEVFEGVRLDADLVTLSACQTGAGKEMAGEGLLGLTWAFQYAGARSVLASLWEVNDAATAELMRAFYRALGAGASKAEALRRAQLELLHRPGTSAPYFWAAFSLFGDGR